ncbi:MAG TPA: 5-methyltetrahydropteroyltriglutamate--homocysteine S-methyltransferase [Polyangiaceae bacterium]
MIQTSLLGYPRIGKARELKRALESHWSGDSPLPSLLATGRALREQSWQTQRTAGIEIVPANDFSLYDHVLDTFRMVQDLPERFGGGRELDAYFMAARGRAPGSDRHATPLEMTKWFDTNYHYLVPEIAADCEFSYRRGQAAEHFGEARALGLDARPVLLGPVTFLMLAKDTRTRRAPLERLPELLEAYLAAFDDLAELGADWLQIDEPCLALELSENGMSAYRLAYRKLADGPCKLLLTTYFGSLAQNLALCRDLPVAGVHVDALAGPEDAIELAGALDSSQALSLGLIDGRGVWRADLEHALTIAERARERTPERHLLLAPNSSLLHVPVDLAGEAGLDPELRGFLAFARQKLDELSLLKRGLVEGRAAIASELRAARTSRDAHHNSPRVRSEAVRRRLASLTDDSLSRGLPAAARRARQRRALELPILPTTTIGSFPQTTAIRKLRAEFRSGTCDAERYAAGMRREIDETIALQERIGLDVLVHGEPERNDMVEYFGEALSGVLVTQNGWVQSYGSRCVKPPIIYGDVARPRPITVEWARYAQSRSKKPVKGMLTGPVTILKWSFVRDDEPLEHTCRTLALALRDEVLDLEAAGIRVIQVDEPAFREALPLRTSERAAYLRWAVACFKLATAAVRDETQIHAHMCYCEFSDVIDSIAALDADVISIESARSAMDLLDAFARSGYPNDVGLGIYDIHSPRVPELDEMRRLLERALSVLDPEQLWVNPDCGLKTRRLQEIVPALENLVAVARQARSRLSATR